MSEKQLIKTDKYFYHVTARTKNREWFKISLCDVWKISIDAMIKAQAKTPVIVSQYVLMMNHYHMLIRTPESNIDQFIHDFNQGFYGIFEEEFEWDLIVSNKQLKNVFSYIYQNPWRVGIVDRCEDYPYSTLFYSSRQLEIPFPFVSLDHLESD